MKSIVIDADCAEIVVGGVKFVRTTSEPPAATTPAEQTPAASTPRKGGPRGPRKQRDDETDVAYAARVEKYHAKHPSVEQPAEAVAPKLEVRKPSNSTQPKEKFQTTVCKCRGDRQTEKKKGTYGKSGYVPAKYAPTNDFSGFGLGVVEIPAGHALGGTFKVKDYADRIKCEGRPDGEEHADLIYDAVVYHTGESAKNGWWMTVLLFDEATGTTVPGNAHLKNNGDIVELFLIECKHCTL